MELYIAGGCGEHGRNCFYITDKFNSIIIDCGMMTGKRTVILILRLPKYATPAIFS